MWIQVEMDCFRPIKTKATLLKEQPEQKFGVLLFEVDVDTGEGKYIPLDNGD